MEEFQSGLGEAWASVATFLPKLLGFILILVIGLFVAKAVAKVLDRVLERVGFDRMVERGGVKRALDRSDYDASDILAKLIFYIAALFVLQLAFGIFGPNPISEMIQGVIGYLPRIFVAIVIVVVASAIAAAVREMIVAAIGGLSYGTTLAGIAAGAILVIGGFAALNQLQIAPAIVNGLFYAMLAIIVGASVIAFGGGGIPVARRYVERWAARADEESDRIAEASEGAQDRIEARARERKAEMEPDASTTSPDATDRRDTTEHRDPTEPRDPLARREPTETDRKTDLTEELDLREADADRYR